MKTKLTYILLVLFLVTGATSCSFTKKSKSISEAEKKEEMMQEEQNMEYEKAKERHLAWQSKQTKDRMKRTKRKSDSFNNKGKRSLWDRIFGKNDCPKFDNDTGG